MYRFPIRMVSIVVCVWWAGGVFAADKDAAKDLSGAEITQQCGFKHPGKDQRSTFTVVLKDKQGSKKKSIYKRIWKDLEGKNDVLDKMILFTEFPPDAKGVAFMRWTFTQAAGKNADQWIYLPELRKPRRVTIRDVGDSFLNSDLTHADIDLRPVEADVHKLIGVKKKGKFSYYVVESTPKESKPLYSKRVIWYKKTADMNLCVTSQIEYYDAHGNLLKDQLIKWQQVKDAWVWDKVLVKNHQSGHQSLFSISDVVVDEGLDDKVFSERTLKAGLRAVPGL